MNRSSVSCAVGCASKGTTQWRRAVSAIVATALGTGILVTGIRASDADVQAPCVGFTTIDGGGHSLAVGPGGALFGWGRNGNGQLGDGTTTDRHTATLVGGSAGIPLAGITAVATGGSHSLAVGPAGIVFAWGWNGYGQLGDGTTTDRHTAAPMNGPLAGITAVAAGDGHSLAVGPGGAVYAWGTNYAGELGDGTAADRHTPAQVTGPGGTPLTGITAISAGGRHALAIGPGGTVYAWGGNDFGQLGDGTTTNRYRALQVNGPGGAPLTGVTAVAAGGVHSLAVGPGGTVYSWGHNSTGQLGDGTTTDRHLAVRVNGPSGPLAGVVAVAGGGSHSLAIGPGGTVYAWGYNVYGQLGESATTGMRQTAVQVNGPGGTPLAGIAVVAGGDYYSLAIGLAGTVYSWGDNSSGQLGDGTTTDRYTPTLVGGCGVPSVPTVSPGPVPTVSLLPTVSPPPLPTLPPGTGHASDDCAAGTVVADGFASGTYVKVRVTQADAQTTWVCVRADGPALDTGGKFVITGPTAAPGGLPTTDSNADACTTAPGNTVPGPHPLLVGALGDPGDPATYLPFLVDSYSSAQATWVCVGVGSVRQRVIVPTGVSATLPTVGFVADAAGPHVPTTVPPATPSGSCQSGGGTRYLDVTSTGTRVFAYSWQPTPTVLKVCVRAEGPLSAGGMLTVDTTAADGALPGVTTSTTDLSPCTVQVAHLDNPLLVDVSRSPTGNLPASICATVGTTKLRITVSTGSGQPPATVTWTPDPGTP